MKGPYAHGRDCEVLANDWQGPCTCGAEAREPKPLTPEELTHYREAVAEWLESGSGAEWGIEDIARLLATLDDVRWAKDNIIDGLRNESPSSRDYAGSLVPETSAERKLAGWMAYVRDPAHYEPGDYFSDDLPVIREAFREAEKA